MQDLYAKVLPDFTQALRGHKILDTGFKVKQSGGSQNLVRFWFLTEKDGELHVTEFKFEQDPAISLYTGQIEDPTVRVQKITEHYRPQSAPLGLYKMIKTKGYQFLARERFKNFVSFDPSTKEDSETIQNARELSLYIANRMGRKQAAQRQGIGLRNHINANEKDVKEFLKMLSEQYIQTMQNEN